MHLVKKVYSWVEIVIVINWQDFQQLIILNSTKMIVISRPTPIHHAATFHIIKKSDSILDYSVFHMV